MDVTTGGAGVSTVMPPQVWSIPPTRSGEDQFEFTATYKRDFLLVSPQIPVPTGEQQVMELGLGGPLAFKKKLTYYFLPCD